MKKNTIFAFESYNYDLQNYFLHDNLVYKITMMLNQFLFSW